MKVKLHARNQITLPNKLVKSLNLSSGDELIAILKDGCIELIPAITIPKGEAYLFTPYWQEALRQAGNETAEGNLEGADNVEEMFQKLEED